MEAKPISPLTAKLFKSYLEDGETIVDIHHEHIFGLLRKLVITSALFFVLPLILLEFVPKLAPVLLIPILIGLWRCFYQTVSWYFNTLITTNLNIVLVTWNGFFDRSAQRIEYHQIESFSYQITGFINTVINRGTTVITKNSGTEVEVPNTYKPKKKTQSLTQIQDHFMTNQQQRQSGAVKDLLTSMLEQHIMEHGITVTED